MAGRGAQTFKKRQKEQQRKEKQQEKFAKRIERKKMGPEGESEDDNLENQMTTAQEAMAELRAAALERPDKNP
jgi:hypothetical protein